MAQPALKPVPDDAEPFYWGSRLVRVPTADGDTRLEETPLTRDDLLDPQEGDIMTHGTLHGLIIRHVADMLDRFFNAEDVAVFDDVKMLWGIPGLSEVAPDISVIRDIRDKYRERSSFSVVEEGVRPCLVIEVISPRSVEIDLTDKVEIYRRAKIPEYLAINILKTPVELTGHRLNRRTRRYHRSPRGSWLSQTTGLRFSPGTKPLEVVLENTVTGERLLTSFEEETARKAAEQRAAAAEQRAAAAEQRAAAAEQRAAAEAAARKALEAELRRLRALQ
ncbi:MAG: Uma2 family endonuclease [bacterium]|nr:Uma2 family endonuclease [bacterium]